MRRCAICFVVFTITCFVTMMSLNTSATLCYDPTAGNFDINAVSRRASFGFVLLYLTPIGFCFFATVVLLTHTVWRLRTIFNSALLKLLMRLIPGPVIFALALVPSVVFQTVEVTTGVEMAAAKKSALLGMNSSGALFACFYFYACVVDKSLSGGNDNRSNSCRSKESELSWIRQSSTSNVLQDGRTATRSRSQGSAEWFSNWNGESGSTFRFGFEVSPRGSSTGGLNPVQQNNSSITDV
mmetsp:Transcript_13498/g.22174  ORF Transcript_13498/g.22174 Transcript_13498/m.22174 type:complete len:240 (+) Transcript_13498:450-1169(+)